MNRAGRLLADMGWLPTRAILTTVRETYQAGMSARELATKVEEVVQ